jgi:hypothetical protein
MYQMTFAADAADAAEHQTKEDTKKKPEIRAKLMHIGDVHQRSNYTLQSLIDWQINMKHNKQYEHYQRGYFGIVLCHVAICHCGAYKLEYLCFSPMLC